MNTYLGHGVEGDAAGGALDVVDVVRLEERVDGERVQLDLDAHGPVGKRSLKM